MKKPELLKDAKRCKVYRYGTDGEITISKRFSVEEEMDYLDLLDSGDIKIINDSQCQSTVDLCGYIVDPDALRALDIIWTEML